jgi:hypothetical protein
MPRDFRQCLIFDNAAYICLTASVISVTVYMNTLTPRLLGRSPFQFCPRATTRLGFKSEQTLLVNILNYIFKC